MTNRERMQAVLHYEDYDRLPLVNFGYWRETLQKWQAEGHLTEDEANLQRDGNEYDKVIADKLGFDFNWQTMFYTGGGLKPAFEPKVIKELPNGSKHILDPNGVVLLQDEHASGIPSEIEHTLKDRASWEEHYKWRYQWSEDRVNRDALERIKNEPRDNPLGIHCGSLFGHIRDVVGITGISYLYMDDEELYREIINTVGDICFRNVEYTLGIYDGFDFAHFWEDICFKNGPLVIPDVFRELVGPHYKRITDLLKQHGIDIISLDCDGCIDALIPTWFENGVNTMFPIEVGTWNASIAPWREQYGKELRGVGGMNKTVFAKDHAAIDAEVKRLKSLIELGGYIPCPDHRIAPDAKFELVKYYCQSMREK